MEVRADPEDPDYAEISELRDGNDRKELDAFPIEVALCRIAASRNAAVERIIKPAREG